MSRSGKHGQPDSSPRKANHLVGRMLARKTGERAGVYGRCMAAASAGIAVGRRSLVMTMAAGRCGPTQACEQRVQRRSETRRRRGVQRGDRRQRLADARSVAGEPEVPFTALSSRLARAASACRPPNPDARKPLRSHPRHAMIGGAPHRLTLVLPHRPPGVAPCSNAFFSRPRLALSSALR
jgi:hypothetical protein